MKHTFIALFLAALHFNAIAANDSEVIVTKLSSTPSETSSEVSGASAAVNTPRSLSISPRIVGGSALSSAPSWMASLIITTADGYNYICGGTLVNSQWVLTAAHCVNYKDSADNAIAVSAIAVNVGKLSLTDTSSQVYADQIITYSGFNDVTYVGDIAMIRLGTSQTATTATMASSSSSSAIADGVKMDIYGWGETSAGVTSDNASATDTLNKGSVTYYKDYNTSVIGDVFAGDIGADTCYGDSGGPLVYNSKLVGVTSYGIDATCGTGTPGAYVDVGYYRTWIDGVISNYSSSTTTTTTTSDGATAPTTTTADTTTTGTGTSTSSATSTDPRDGGGAAGLESLLALGFLAWRRAAK